MRKEIRICGFGGQGIILAGVILGRAACVYSDFNAVQTQSYGPEARGGASRIGVIISDGEIGYPGMNQPDVLVAMSQQAWDKYKKNIKESSTIIIDPDLIKTEGAEDYYKVRSMKIATDLGSRLSANIVMLGALVGITNIVSRDAIDRAVVESVPRRTIEVNRSALEEGFKVGSKLKKEGGKKEGR